MWNDVIFGKTGVSENRQDIVKTKPKKHFKFMFEHNFATEGGTLLN